MPLKQGISTLGVKSTTPEQQGWTLETACYYKEWAKLQHLDTSKHSLHQPKAARTKAQHNFKSKAIFSNNILKQLPTSKCFSSPTSSLHHQNSTHNFIYSASSNNLSGRSCLIFSSGSYGHTSLELINYTFRLSSSSNIFKVSLTSSNLPHNYFLEIINFSSQDTTMVA